MHGESLGDGNAQGGLPFTKASGKSQLRRPQTLDDESHCSTGPLVPTHPTRSPNSLYLDSIPLKALFLIASSISVNEMIRGTSSTGIILAFGKLLRLCL